MKVAFLMNLSTAPRVRNDHAPKGPNIQLRQCIHDPHGLQDHGDDAEKEFEGMFICLSPGVDLIQDVKETLSAALAD